MVRNALAYMLPRLPFPLREVHPDNGNEFLNQHVMRFLAEAYPHVTLSRSRGGQPNDNRLVGENNGSVVRYYLGDDRLDTVMQTCWLNTIYEQIGQFHNFIQPVMKQIARAWVPPTANRQGYVKRQHDTARSPLERLYGILGPDSATCQALMAQYEHINPLQLPHDMRRAPDHLFTYPKATPNQVESIFETLADPAR